MYDEKQYPSNIERHILHEDISYKIAKTIFINAGLSKCMTCAEYNCKIKHILTYLMICYHYS